MVAIKLHPAQPQHVQHCTLIHLFLNRNELNHLLLCL